MTNPDEFAKDLAVIERFQRVESCVGKSLKKLFQGEFMARVYTRWPIALAERQQALDALDSANEHIARLNKFHEEDYQTISRLCALLEQHQIPYKKASSDLGNEGEECGYE